MVLPTQNKNKKHCNDSSNMNNKNAATNDCDKSAPNTKLRQSNGNCRTFKSNLYSCRKILKLKRSLRATNHLKKYKKKKNNNNNNSDNKKK